MSEVEKLGFESEVDEKGRIKITDEVQKAANIVPGSIVTIKMDPILDVDKKPVEIPANEPKHFEFIDKTDEEGRLKIPDLIEKAAHISSGYTVKATLEHVLGEEEKKTSTNKFQFMDKVDDDGRLKVPDMIKKAADMSPGDIVTIRLKHVLDIEKKPVEILVEDVDEFDFTAEVDDEGFIVIPENMRESVPILPGNVVTVKMELILDAE